ncbi:MAG: DUF177 domain-containing protein [Bacteroidetes bacterium]|nr:MAG: DUF177 domain-containing protein [Bacteroidota bacterium]
MKALKPYSIEISSLPFGINEFHFILGADFFKCFENDLFNTGKFEAKVVLDKSDRMIVAQFDLQGSLELVCDRSLDTFDYPVQVSEEMFFNFGDSFEELSDNVLIIPRNIQNLDLAQYIYEYIGLAVPMKKLHPRFVLDDSEDNVLIYSTKKDLEEDEPEQDIDPRWQSLNKLKK